MFLEQMLIEVRRVAERLVEYSGNAQIRGIQADLTDLGNRIEDEIRRTAAGPPGCGDAAEEAKEAELSLGVTPGRRRLHPSASDNNQAAEEAPDATAAFYNARVAAALAAFHLRVDAHNRRLDAHDVRLSRVEVAMGVR